MQEQLARSEVLKMTRNSSEFTFLDLFAGAGGLSEGFLQAGFLPIAHVEADKAACAKN